MANISTRLDGTKEKMSDERGKAPKMSDKRGKAPKMLRNKMETKHTINSKGKEHVDKQQTNAGSTVTNGWTITHTESEPTAGGEHIATGAYWTSHTFLTTRGLCCTNSRSVPSNQLPK
jgi:hypothetical protein